MLSFHSTLRNYDEPKDRTFGSHRNCRIFSCEQIETRETKASDPFSPVVSRETPELETVEASVDCNFPNPFRTSIQVFLFLSGKTRIAHIEAHEFIFDDILLDARTCIAGYRWWNIVSIAIREPCEIENFRLDVRPFDFSPTCGETWLREIYTLARRRCGTRRAKEWKKKNSVWETNRCKIDKLSGETSRDLLSTEAISRFRKFTIARSRRTRLHL